MSDNLLSTPSVVGGVCAGVGAVARTEQRLQTVGIQQNTVYHTCYTMINFVATSI